MIIDAMSSMIPTADAFAAAEGSLARLQGYLEHFQQTGDAEARTTLNINETREKVATSTAAAHDRFIGEDAYFAMLDDAQIDLSFVYTEKYGTRLGISTADNVEVAEFVAKHPDKLLGLGGIDPWEDDSADRVDEAVTDLGLRGVVVSPFKQNLTPGDPRMARVFARCEALGIPALLHAGINWWFEAPYDAGHPRYIDQLANTFSQIEDRRAALRLAVGARHDDGCVAPPQCVRRHLRAPPQALHGRGVRVDTVAALRQPNAVTQGLVRLDLDTDRNAAG